MTTDTKELFPNASVKFLEYFGNKFFPVASDSLFFIMKRDINKAF